MDDRTLRLIQLQCLARLKKLGTKLERGEITDIERLFEISTALTLMLHDLGVDFYVSEEFKIADRLDRSLAKKTKAGASA